MSGLFDRTRRTTWLVLVGFFFLMQGKEALASTSAYGLHTEVSPLVSWLWLQKEVTFPPNTIDATVCLQVELQYTYRPHSTIIGINNSVALLVSEYYFATVIGVTLDFKTPPVPHWTWVLVCMLLGNHTDLALDGKIAPSVAPTTLGHVDLTIPYNITVGLPDTYFEDKAFVVPMAGRVTLPQVFPRRLSETEMLTLAACGHIPDVNLGEGKWQLWSDVHGIVGIIDGNASSSQYTAQNNVSNNNFKTAEVKDEELCYPRAQGRLVVTKGKALTFQETFAFCNTYFGELPDPENSMDIEELIEVVYEHNIPILTVWSKPQDDICFGLIIQSQTADSVPMSCLEKVTTFACRIPRNKTFELRVDELSNLNAILYLAPRDMTTRFVSLDRMQIFAEETSLTLEYEVERLSCGYYEGLQTVGRNEWVDEEGAKINMTITVCLQDEFTCSDGHCIPLHLRCNGLEDCEDGSDEWCSLLLPLPRTYKKDRPYNFSTPMNFTVIQMDLLDVDEYNNVFKVKTQFRTSWRDGRVHLFQLSGTYSDNILERESVWTPEYKLENAVFEDELSHLKKEGMRIVLFAHKDGPGRIITHQGVEGYVYNVEKNAYLELVEIFVASYSCHFDVSLFPFDIHICHVNISLLKQNKSFRTAFQNINVSGTPPSADLPLFTPSKVCFIEKLDSSNRITGVAFQILLERRYGSYIFTTFGPCLVLNLIGCLTQCFASDNFSDRIMVTLSCLIVVAALFAQIATTTPSSASPKAIDIIFFAIIIRLFAVVLHHTFLFLIQAYVRRSKGNNPNASLVVTPRNKDDDQLSGPAIYSPPKVHLPVTPWVEAGQPSGPVVSWADEEGKVKETKRSRPSVDKIFNVLSVSLGLIWDITFCAVYFLGIYSLRKIIQKNVHNCSY